jgi:two-component system, chemotaxis family, protein-glutamate methylesterase/glutaminase
MATNKRSSPAKKKSVAVKNERRAKEKINDVPVKGDRPYYIVCVGASAGGITAILELVSQLSPSLNAAVFIVLHLSKSALGDVLLQRVRRDAKLPCKLAEHNERILPGHIYLALPDAHLLVKKDTIVIGKGPAENRFRPSIDVLFRSAAASYGERVIGIVLTGFLNDGSIGMLAIKESGGHCIVQDPNEAEYPDMPISVLQILEVDHVVPLKKMNETIENIIRHHQIKGIVPPHKIIAESRISEKAATGIGNINGLGEKAVFSCPDCGGSLWKIQNGKVKHYRCHIGHSYTEEDLLIKQADNLEQTLWVAVRMMEERKINLMRLEEESRDKGLERLANSYRDQSSHLEEDIAKLKELLFTVQSE